LHVFTDLVIEVILGLEMDRVDPKDFPEIMKLYNWEA